jgi:hypothetical protein
MSGTGTGALSGNGARDFATRNGDTTVPSAPTAQDEPRVAPGHRGADDCHHDAVRELTSGGAEGGACDAEPVRTTKRTASRPTARKRVRLFFPSDFMY